MDKRENRGFTLVEVLIVLTIVLFLIGLAFAFLTQINKGNDSKRKDDLEKIRVAFEDYYNDHNCYPDISILGNCGSDALAPYLARIPCDPKTKAPYIGIAGTEGDSNCNYWFKVYTLLDNESDFSIAKVGLTGEYSIDGQRVNYGVSSPNVSVGRVEATTFICPTTGQAASRMTTCPNPYVFVGQCGAGACSCQAAERVFRGSRGYYCCPDPSCN